MDEVVKKIAALGLPGILLVIAISATGLAGGYGVVAALAGLGGPFGIIGGLGVLGLTTLVGEAIAGFGIEAVLKNIYAERRKTESVRYLLKEIKDLPITEDLKLKLKNELNPTITDNFEEVQPPKTIEIVEE
ncbi:MAG: hypothetical protein RMY64_07190 [Nostoc sp. DedQUE08]|uniref:hypothetical protein n=1 Tax=unclassified Nostoc TaxID=2593658 RepID=UPI002AD511F8|nr:MULTISPECIES: hypothetical protein [unclassified Nostoc]MDZ8031163.1 hypothetical protein [Nostoc sp. DedSLP04]MDZ8065412.1 hypothetical protein [Nostoc sp. DedQUE08]MDZ8095150.1 hypothetical protein [Nostoc sp. DedQUE05]MDZ8128482.1 hypothetical protein [Nostoc sp. DedQUE07]MDZ8136275.1 hypothetical protein [Nostoc sp. DedQUE04]